MTKLSPSSPEMETGQEIVIALSGGMDSLALLACCLASSDVKRIIPIHFTYGSKHNRWEFAAARRINQYYKTLCPERIDYLREVDFSESFAELQIKSNLLQSGGPIPEGHYADESMKQTVVPARNIIFTSFLASKAMSEGCDSVLLGVHSGDHPIYPDCRPQFVTSMRYSVFHGTGGKVTLRAPFLYLSKGELLAAALKRASYRIPFELSRTCYKDQELPCGKCGACVERKEAFEHAGIKDPVIYAK